MKVFVTGATGFVGSAVVDELKSAGHKVIGLARSASGAEKLKKAEIEVHQGDLEDPKSLGDAASKADAIIHTAFNHDFSKFKENCLLDGRAIEALGQALKGSQRPLIVTSGLSFLSCKLGEKPNEESVSVPSEHNVRISEKTALSFLKHKVHVSVVRVSTSVHGKGDYGFIPLLIDLAKKKGFSGYIDEGKNQWTAVHRIDAGHLFRLALEHNIVGARHNGCAEEGVSLKEIATIIGDRLRLPVRSISRENAADHFGWFAGLAGINSPASAKLTRERLGWTPRQPGLLADLKSDNYFAS